MVDRIKLTEDDIDIIHFKLTDDECHVRFCSLEGEEIVWTDKQSTQLKHQILDDHDKIDNITKFAKTLAYSIPAVSWQLKQLLEGKTVDVK